MPLSPKTALEFNKISAKIDHGTIGDLIHAYPLFIYCSLIALVFSITFLAVFWFMGKWIAYVLIICFSLTCLIMGTYMLVTIYKTGPLNSATNASRVKFLEFMIKYKIRMTILAVVLLIAAIAVFYLFIKYRKTLKIGVEILELACKDTFK